MQNSRRRYFWQTVLLLAGLLVLILISTASVYFVNRARSDAGWVTHSIEVTNQISTLLLLVRRAESAERGFLLTEEDIFASDFETASAAIAPALDRLGELTQDNPAQSRILADMTPLIDKRIERYRSIIDLARSQQTGDAITAIREGLGRSDIVRLNNLADLMLAEESRLLSERSAAADRSQLLAAVITIVGSLLVVALAIISLLLVRRSTRIRDKAERQLRDSNLILENSVAERTADLREANDELQRYAYIVSHDLRAPLVNIMGFTSELETLHADIFKRLATLGNASYTTESKTEPELSDADRELSESYVEALDFIKSSVEKMDRLIGAILKLSREGRREFHPAEIDVTALVDGIVTTMAHQMQEAEAEIGVDPLPTIVSDRLALEQIFSNLIDNALKYLKSGVPGRISVNGKRKLGFVVYQITDNGRGIDPRDHQRVFDLFRRAGVQDRPGQGIGLAHVRALVRRMGGNLSLSSQLGEGSTFTITLPAEWAIKDAG